tara:strand:- start:277 stop:471 length:195 start_codon:yes stop_codon:yes gene_type:complete
MKTYMNGPRKNMMYGGMPNRKPMMGTDMRMGMKKGGKFGMLSVNAGVDNNPKPTLADKIVGATK